MNTERETILRQLAEALYDNDIIYVTVTKELIAGWKDEPEYYIPTSLDPEEARILYENAWDLYETQGNSNDWYNRETIQDNINSMFPDRPQEEYKCDQCRFETISKSMMIEHYHKVHESRVSSSMMFGEYGSLIK